ncbi:MAG: hypothetical protein ACPW60_02940 [Methylohalobius sp. ZOD2]
MADPTRDPEEEAPELFSLLKLEGAMPALSHRIWLDVARFERVNEDLWGLSFEESDHLVLGRWVLTANQARRQDRIPALAFRESHQAWRFIVPLVAINRRLPASFDLEQAAIVSLPGFIRICRQMPTGPP